MTGPLIADLDQALREAGQDVTLRRLTGTAPAQATYDVTVRAAVRSFRPDEIVGGISETDSLVIIGPSEIAAAGWPGDGEVASDMLSDPTLPRRTDRVIINGRARIVDAVLPFVVGGVLVRIEMRVKG